MRSQAFGNRRPARPSLSSISARHRSAPSISRNFRPASRPGTNTDSTCSTGTTIALRRPVVYMDAPNPCSDFIWNGFDPCPRPSSSSTARPLSQARSTVASQEDFLDNMPNLQPEIEVGLGELPGYTKIPLYVPRRIERNQPFRPVGPDRTSLTPVPATPGVVSEHSQRTTSNSGLENLDATTSDNSFASLRGQTSIQSQTEREAMMQERDGISRMPAASSSNSDRLSKILSTAWSEGTSRLKQKGRRRN